MRKRGQSTTFVVLGMIVIVFAIIASYLSSQKQEQETTKELQEDLTLPPYAQSVRSLMQSCVEDTARESLLVVGLQGGYYQQQKEVIPTELQVQRGAKIRQAKIRHGGFFRRENSDILKCEFNHDRPHSARKRKI